jgi:excisionase family DNA binding protein
MKDKINVGRPEDGEDNELLDKLDVAQWLDVSVGMVDVLRRAGKLRAIKVGRRVRFERPEVKRYLNGEREGGGRGGKHGSNGNGEWPVIGNQ